MDKTLSLDTITANQEQLRELITLPLGTYFANIPLIQVLDLIEQIEKDSPDSKIQQAISFLKNSGDTSIATLTWSQFVEICSFHVNREYTILKRIFDTYTGDIKKLPLQDLIALIDSHIPKSFISRTLQKLTNQGLYPNLYLISSYTEKELEKIEEISEKSVKEIKALLMLAGLQLATEEERVISGMSYITMPALRRYLIWNGITNLEQIANMSTKEFSLLIDYYASATLQPYLYDSNKETKEKLIGKMANFLKNAGYTTCRFFEER